MARARDRGCPSDRREASGSRRCPQSEPGEPPPERALVSPALGFRREFHRSRRAPTNELRNRNSNPRERWASDRFAKSRVRQPALRRRVDEQLSRGRPQREAWHPLRFEACVSPSVLKEDVPTKAGGTPARA